jgi:hypothetical protein
VARNGLVRCDSGDPNYPDIYALAEANSCVTPQATAATQNAAPLTSVGGAQLLTHRPDTLRNAHSTNQAIGTRHETINSKMKSATAASQKCAVFEHPIQHTIFDAIEPFKRLSREVLIFGHDNASLCKLRQRVPCYGLFGSRATTQ